MLPYLSVEPTGEKQRTTFKFLRTRSIKKRQQFSRLSGDPVLLTCNMGERCSSCCGVHYASY